MVKVSSKMLAIIAAAVIVISAGITCWVVFYRPRSSVLKIYNWEDYIDEDLIAEFQEYYREKSGDKKFKVKYSTFTDNEELLTQIETQGRDYDIIFPSEYMVEKLKAKSLLKKIDTANDIFANADTGNYDNLDLQITGKMAYAKTGTDIYAVPYVYGTLGIMYDKDEMTADDIATLTSQNRITWGALWGNVGDETKNTAWREKYRGKVTMKKSARDTIGIAMMYAVDERASKDSYEEYLSAANLSKTLNMEDGYTLEMAKTALENQRKWMAPTFENDEGKEMFANADNHQFAYGLYWSCDAGLAMSENDSLAYYTPQYTNFWIDNFALPVTGTEDAETTKAAYEFINFMLDKQNAVRNMDYVGSAMAITDAKNEYTTYVNQLKTDGEITSDDQKFLTGTEFLGTMFPSSNHMGSYGAVMKNFATDEIESGVNDLMIQVMLDAALDEDGGGSLLWLWITLAVLVAGGLGFLAYWLLSHRRAKTVDTPAAK